MLMPLPYEARFYRKNHLPFHSASPAVSAPTLYFSISEYAGLSLENTSSEEFP